MAEQDLEIVGVDSGASPPTITVTQGRDRLAIPTTVEMCKRAEELRTNKGVAVATVRYVGRDREIVGVAKLS